MNVADIKDLIEGESLVSDAEFDGGSLIKQGMGYWTNDSTQWSGNEQAFYHSTTTGNSVSFTLPVKSKGKYNLIVYYTQAPDYGVVQPTLDEDTIGQPFDAYNTKVVPSSPVSYGPIELKSGPHELKFEITGKNSLSKGYLAGWDGFLLQKVE